MAVAFDSAGSNATASNVTSLNVAVNNAAGTYMIAWVGVDAPSSSGHTMTYGGVSMTEIASQLGSELALVVFGLASPATGSNTLAASWTTADHAGIGCVTLTGVGSVGTADKAALASDTSNFTTTQTLAADDMMVGAGYTQINPAGLGVATGTERSETASASAAINVATNTGTGSTTIVWTRGSSRAIYISVPLVASVAPAGSAVVPTLLMMGAG